MARFILAIPFLLEHEGGYVNDPADRGGETAYGITRRDHPDAWVNGPPTEQEAEEIYRNAYWNALYLDEVQEQPLANKLLDTAVHCGVKRTAKWWQTALNLVRGVVGKSLLVVDGVVGPHTRAAQAELNQAYSWTVIVDLALQQTIHYLEIAKADPTQEKFLDGWLSRAKWLGV